MCQKQSSFVFTTWSLLLWGQWPQAGTMAEKSSYNLLLLFTICVAIVPRNLSYLSSPIKGRHCILWRKIKPLQHKSWLPLVAVACSRSGLWPAREGLCEATKLGEPKWDSVRIGISGLGGPSPRVASRKCREKYFLGVEMQRWYGGCQHGWEAQGTMFRKGSALFSLQSHICRVTEARREVNQISLLDKWTRSREESVYLISIEVFLVSVDCSTFWSV